MAIATTAKLPSANAMAVKSLTANQVSATTSSSTSQAASTNLDYNAFLQLLVAELKNQDPTKPMDSAAYMAQLASFSNVEQATKTNAKLDSLLTAQSLTQGSSLIGRQITSPDGSMQGIVKDVTITSSGMTATLASGDIVQMGPGVKISAA